MVRLMLVLAPVACILSGISVSTILTTYMKVSVPSITMEICCSFPVSVNRATHSNIFILVFCWTLNNAIHLYQLENRGHPLESPLDYTS